MQTDGLEKRRGTSSDSANLEEPRNESRNSINNKIRSRTGRLTPVACVPCQKRKSKCDGLRPACTACLSRSAPCTFEVADGVSRTADMRQKNMTLAARVNELEKLVSKLRFSDDARAASTLARLRLGDEIKAILNDGADLGIGNIDHRVNRLMHRRQSSDSQASTLPFHTLSGRSSVEIGRSQTTPVDIRSGRDLSANGQEKWLAPLWDRERDLFQRPQDPRIFRDGAGTKRTANGKAKSPQTDGQASGGNQSGDPGPAYGNIQGDYQGSAYGNFQSDHQGPADGNFQSDHQGPADGNFQSDHQGPADGNFQSDHHGPADGNAQSKHQSPAYGNSQSDHQSPAHENNQSDHQGRVFGNTQRHHQEPVDGISQSDHQSPVYGNIRSEDQSQYRSSSGRVTAVAFPRQSSTPTELRARSYPGHHGQAYGTTQSENQGPPYGNFHGITQRENQGPKYANFHDNTQSENQGGPMYGIIQNEDQAQYTSTPGQLTTVSNSRQINDYQSSKAGRFQTESWQRSAAVISVSPKAIDFLGLSSSAAHNGGRYSQGGSSQHATENISLPIWAILPRHEFDDDVLNRAYSEFLAQMGDMLRRGVPFTSLCGKHPMIEALFDQAEFNNADELSKWSARIAFTCKPRSMEQVVIFWSGWLLMRWLVMPTAEFYEGVPHWLRPTPRQLVVPHNVSNDFVPWALLRDAICVRPDMQQNLDWLHELNRTMSCNWPGNIDGGLYKDGVSGRLFLNPLAMDHVADMKNWTVGPRFRVHMPNVDAFVAVKYEAE